MAGIGIDASTPALANDATGTIATASFTPPAGSLVLVMWACNAATATDSPPPPSIADSLASPLAYTLGPFATPASTGTTTVGGQAALWTAPVPVAAPMTITVTDHDATTGYAQAGLQVMVLTGANLSSPVQSSGVGALSTAGATFSQSYTPARSGTGGMAFMAATDWAIDASSMGAGTGCTLISSDYQSPNVLYGFLRRTSADDVAGTPSSVSGTLNIADTILWAWADIAPASSIPAPPQTLPGPVWRRRFQRPQTPPVSAVTPTSGPQLYPLQQPAGNIGTYTPPIPPTTATSPPIQPGTTWRRYFQHPQQTIVVPAPPAVSPDLPLSNPTFGAAARVSRAGDTMSGRLVNTRAITAGTAVLTDAPTITVDASAGLHFRVTLGGNRTLGSPVNATDGQKITFEVIQDGTGGRTLALGSAYAVTSPPGLTSAAGKRDFLGFIYSATTGLWYPAGLAEGF